MEGYLDSVYPWRNLSNSVTGSYITIRGKRHYPSEQSSVGRSLVKI